MNEKLKKTFTMFIGKFGYAPAFPREVFFDEDAYEEVLKKSISDSLDYTIEKYGTKVPKYMGVSDVLID